MKSEWKNEEVMRIYRNRAKFCFLKQIKWFISDREKIDSKTSSDCFL